MSTHEKLKIEEEFKAFTAKNFEKPSVCRNFDQVRFYSSELCLKISECERKFNFVPAWAYALLEQYYSRQNCFSEIPTEKTSH